MSTRSLRIAIEEAAKNFRRIGSTEERDEGTCRRTTKAAIIRVAGTRRD
jgi:hypothetical protein